jgi:predicted adenylyl cyclase CyaB
MSSERKEVEIKFRLDDALLSNVEKLVSEPYEELDEYFFSSKEAIDESIFLRFRSKKGKIFLELKAVTLGGEDTQNVYESDETEVEVSADQYSMMKRMFKVAFPISMEVRKNRGKGVFNDCELCLDSVDGLGDFLEIEGPKEKIMEACEMLGIDIDRQRDKERGYAVMMLRKLGLY